MKRIFGRAVKIFVLILTMLSLVTCNKTSSHTHEYDEIWSYDETCHWRSATCSLGDDCLGATLDIAPHTMTDGACTVCGYTESSSDSGEDNENTPDSGEDNENTPDSGEGSENTPDNGDGNENTPDNGEGNENTPDSGEGNENTPDSGEGNENTPDNGEGNENTPDSGEGSENTPDVDDPPVCTNHNYTSNIVTNPTCIESGEKLYTCSLCGDSYTEALNPTGHTESTVSGSKPTCVESGFSDGISCSVCGAVILQQIELYPAGHKFSDGFCKICGAVDNSYVPPVEPDPYAIYVSTTNNYCWVDKVSFTAEETGEYSFTLPAGLGAWDAEDYTAGTPGPVIDSLHPNYTAKESSFAVFIAAGSTYEFYIAAAIKEDWTIKWSFTPGELPPEEPEDPEQPEEENWWNDPDLDLSGTYYGTDAFGNQLLVVVIDSSTNSVIFSYEHPLTGPNMVNATYSIVNGSIVLCDESGKPLNPLAGMLSVVDGIPTSASFNATEYTLSTEPPEGGNMGGMTEDVEIKATMIDGEENTFSVTEEDLAADTFYLMFMPVNGGAYVFSSKNIFVMSVYTLDGEKIKINEKDQYILNSYGRYVLEISSEYLATPGDYTITPIYIYPEGHVKNPIWYAMGESFKADYKGDSIPVWYQFYASVTGILTVTAEGELDNVTFAVGSFIDYSITENASISLPVVKGRKYYIGVADYSANSEVKIGFSATIEECDITTDGSINVPHHITEGENAAEMQDYEGMYFIYKASATGIHSFSTDCAGYSWCFTDLTAPVELVNGDISLHITYGETVYIYVENTNGTSGEFSFNVSVKNDPSEVWIDTPFIIDGSAPNLINIEDNTYAHFQLRGETGSFIFSWDNADAILEVDGVAVENGSLVEVTSPWFGPDFTLRIDGYEAGEVNLIITLTA